MRTFKMDNMSLKEIQSKLLLWESSENALAPLTSEQREAILDLETLIVGVPEDADSVDDSTQQLSHENVDKSSIPQVNTTYDFLEWYESLCDQNLKADDTPYEAYYKQLDDRKNECVSLTNQIEQTMSDLNRLSEEYELVSNKTNALHTMSEQLLADQNKLSGIGDDIKQRLQYFTQVDQLSQRLNSTTMSVNSDAFFTLLARIDECLQYMRDNSTLKEAAAYRVKYRHLQARGVSLLRSYAAHVLDRATEQVLSPIEEPGEAAETAYAVYFGKFQAAAPRLRRVISEIETRAEHNDDYASLLSDIQREYTSRRARVSGAAATAALAALAAKRARDRAVLLRSAAAMLAHACRDECALYYHFFERTSAALEEYLQSLCMGLYETLRPHIIHIDHLETLAELCAILRVEIIEEQVNNDPSTLGALGSACALLLQDAMERLVFRAHVTLRRDVLRYRPAPGDLAYPDKLEMMEQIALSIQEQALKRSDSRGSMASDASLASAEVAALTEARRPSAVASPADLHGMWYPAVRRTLAALSRLYRCLEKKVFQGLAQEAISLCVESVENAAKQISATKTVIDGELFEIKHLLILREQIAPFQVDFVIKETSLDFSNMKNAAYGLIQRPRQIFSLNSNNTLLEFMLEGTPMVREHLLDSRKEVDRQLKACCESFIKDATEVLAGPIIEFLEKAQTMNPPTALPSQPWATPPAAAAAVAAARRRVGSQLAPLQRSMQLYLANKETEFILFRPIRNNVVGYFVQMEQLLVNAGYSQEDCLIVGCPTPEQMSVFISSASLISHSEPVLPYGKKRKTSTIRKPSVTSVQEQTEKPGAAITELTTEKPKLTDKTETTAAVEDVAESTNNV